MKLIKQITCLVVCFVLLSSSFMVGYAAEDLTFPSEHYYATLYPNAGVYSVATLSDIVPQYDWYANSSFSFSDAILSGDDFILYEDLPYGLDTIVVCCNYGFTVLLFFLNGDATVVPSLIETWNANGKCMIALMSTSPIFRIGYNTGSGKPIQFLSYTGLTNDNNTITQIDDVKYYGFSYTFSENDIYLSLTNNSKDMDKTITLNGDTLEAEYGIFTYPTRANLNQQLQQEQTETSKSIWETLKSVLEYIKNLPSNIADSIKTFFSELGDRISGFFNSLGDRMSDFFTTLKNYLLYFQYTEPEHVNPFSGILDGISSFFDEQLEDTDEFKSSLNTTFDNVSGYIETGSNIINKLLNGVPILNTVLIFFLAFAVIRKVVGR